MGRLYNRVLLELDVPPPYDKTEQNKLPEKSFLKRIIKWLKKEITTIQDKEEIHTEVPGDHNYWITPAGERIKLEAGAHESFAQEWLDKNAGADWVDELSKYIDHGEDCDISTILEDRGWIRVLNWKAKEIFFVSFPGRKKIPQCQKKVIADICIEAGIQFPDDFN